MSKIESHPSSDDPPRVLVVGLGVAGATLAWQLMWRGAGVWVVDPRDPNTTSRAAAGLITPITGKGMAMSWRFPELWARGLKFYQQLAAETGEEVFHACPTVRLFASAAEARKLQRRIDAGGDYLGFVAGVFGEDALPDVLAGQDVCAPHGGFVMKGGGWVR